MKRCHLFLATLSGLTVLFVSSANAAAVPQTISYQGRLTNTDGDPVPDSPILVKFTIWDATDDGTALWNSGFQTITPANGLFTYTLGSNVNLPNNLFTDTIRYLGITVGTDPELAPRTRLTSASYAFQSMRADSASVSVSSMNADSLEGNPSSYYLDWNNLTNVPVEPGIAYDFDGVNINLTSIVTAYDSVIITLPSEGYVLAMAQAQINMRHYPDSEETIRMCITRDTVFMDFNSSGLWRMDPTAPSMTVGLIGQLSATKVDSLAAGTYKYYLNANASELSFPPDAQLTRRHLTVLYFPKAYGTVASKSVQTESDNFDKGHK